MSHHLSFAALARHGAAACLRWPGPCSPSGFAVGARCGRRWCRGRRCRRAGLAEARVDESTAPTDRSRKGSTRAWSIRPTCCASSTATRFEARVRVWPGLDVDTKVRLRGIDAAELHARCADELAKAQAARTALETILAEGGVADLAGRHRQIWRPRRCAWSRPAPPPMSRPPCSTAAGRAATTAAGAGVGADADDGGTDDGSSRRIFMRLIRHLSSDHPLPDHHHRRADAHPANTDP